MQKALKMKILIGIFTALSALGVLVAHELRVSQQTADAANKLAGERDKAKQIDQEDKAAIQKIRERNAKKAASTANQK
jgi:hypothetical protein